MKIENFGKREEGKTVNDLRYLLEVYRDLQEFPGHKMMLKALIDLIERVEKLEEGK